MRALPGVGFAEQSLADGDAGAGVARKQTTALMIITCETLRDMRAC